MAIFDARLFGFNFGPFNEDPPPEDGMVRVYHGTSDHGARLIAKRGFKAPDFDGLVAQVADESGIAAADIKAKLDIGSFHAVRRGYGDHAVAFTDSPLFAAHWARWGGEAYHEAWAAVMAIRTNTDMISQDMFVLAEQRHTHIPTVVAFDVHHGALQDGDRPLTVALFEPDSPPTGWDQLLARIHEASLLVPALEARLVSSRPIEPVWTERRVAEHLQLRPWDSLDPLIGAGDLPEPDDSRMGRMFWWDSTIHPFFQPAKVG